VQCSLKKVGSKGLMSVDQIADWQRGGQGGENVAANALLAAVLTQGAILGRYMNDTAFSSSCTVTATSVKDAINCELWDDMAGAFIDNPNSTLHPQDGNSIALWFNITSAERAERISAYLQTNWSPIGAISPEWIYKGKAAIGTFPGSMEVMGHAAAGRADLAVELIKRQWGYMLNHENSTQSTFWEGYQADGQYAFQGIYMSHAHGWAAGPAAALSFHILGLRPDSTWEPAETSKYIVTPQFGGLTYCEGSLHFGHGRVHVTWRATLGTNHYLLIVDATEHPEGLGVVGLPLPPTRSVPEVFVRCQGCRMPLRLTSTGPRSSDRIWYQIRGGRTHFEVSQASVVEANSQSIVI